MTEVIPSRHRRAELCIWLRVGGDVAAVVNTIDRDAIALADHLNDRMMPSSPADLNTGARAGTQGKERWMFADPAI